MTAFEALSNRWRAVYRERLTGTVSEERLQRMADSAARRGDKPPPLRGFPITRATLQKQVDDALALSLLDKLRLWPGIGVIRRKVMGMGNWRTTLLAAVAAALNYALVVVNNGTAVPQNEHDWVMLLLSASIVGMGAVMKDAAVGSQPGDPPTPARLAGRLEHGETVPADEIKKSADAVRVVDTLAR